MALEGKFEYEIIIPSRKRPHLMQKMLSMVPNAIVTVHESEREAYEAVVPKDQLVIHQITGGGPKIRNWMLEHFQAPHQIQMDDDLQYVETQIGRRKRRLKKADDIERILENQIVCSTELSIDMFCFSRNQNNAMAKPEAFPFRFVYPLSSTISFNRNTPRRYEFAEECRGRSDTDLTLQVLQKGRIMLADCRFYFVHGGIFAGKGGNVGLLTQEDMSLATDNLHKRWGNKYIVREKKQKFGKDEAIGQINMSIRVKRRSSLAVTR